MRPLDFKLKRIRLGLGQWDVAVLCGVSQSTVSNWEKGYVPIPPRASDKLKEYETAVKE